MEPLNEALRALPGPSDLQAPAAARLMRGTSHRSAYSPCLAVGPARASRMVAVGLSVLTLAMSSAPSAAADESMRCGNDIVTAPISAQELLRKCGAPAKKEATTEEVRAGGRSGTSREVGTTTVERWTYNSGGQSLPMVATVVDGQVVKLARAE
jgi:Protein of unknown function (DUF2845)